MDIKNIQHFLKKFEIVFSDKKDIEEKMQHILRMHVPSISSDTKTTIRNGVISIHTTPLCKIGIALRRELLVQEFSKGLNKKITTILFT